MMCDAWDRAKKEKKNKQLTLISTVWCMRQSEKKKKQQHREYIFSLIFFFFFCQRNLHVYKSHQEKGKSKFSPSGMPCKARNREREKSHRTNLYTCRFGEVNATQSKITIPQISLSKKR